MPFQFFHFNRAASAISSIQISLRVVGEAETELGSLLAKLDTYRYGLTAAESRQRLKQYGWNDVIFVQGLLFQTLIIHLLRIEKIPFIQSMATLPVLLTTGLAIAIALLLPFTPLGANFGLVPLPTPYFP